MTSITLEVVQEGRVSSPATPSGPRTSSPSGLVCWLYTRPIEPTIDWIEQKFAGKPHGARGEHPRLQGRLPLRRDRRALRLLLRGHAGGARAGRVPQHHRQHRPGLGAHRRRRTRAASRSSSAPTRSPRPRTSSTSCPSTSSSGCARSRPRTRSPAIGAALGAAFGGGLGVTTTSGPGHRPEVGDDGPGHQPRAAAARHRHPARRPVDRACRPRPSRPTCCTPCTAATARRRCRSWRPRPPATASTPPSRRSASRVKYRTPVILLSDGYLANGAEPWRLPDVDDLPDIDPGFATEPNHTDDDGTAVFWPYVRDERDARPALGAARARRARAPHRRPREVRTARATSPTTAPTTSG